MTQPERELLLIVAKEISKLLPWSSSPVSAEKIAKRLYDAIAAVERQEKEGKDAS